MEVTKCGGVILSRDYPVCRTFCKVIPARHSGLRLVQYSHSEKKRVGKPNNRRTSLPCPLILIIILPSPTSVLIDNFDFVLVEQLARNHSLRRILVILLDNLPFFVVPPYRVRADAKKLQVGQVRYTYRQLSPQLSPVHVPPDVERYAVKNKTFKSELVCRDKFD